MIAGFVYLEKRGQDYWACCPFHHEKTPSFVVHRDKQFYHCFGCGKSGNVISFLTEYERMTYPEAVEWLAQRANMPIPKEEESEETKRARLLRERALAALKAAARFYFDNLYKPEGRPAIDYINKRGLTDETVKEFGIGYSFDGSSLPAKLKEAGFDEETMKYAGLLGEYDGRTADFQAGRLIIPIINAAGQVIAFGGRALDNDRQPKYKNTSATRIFDKKRSLFGLNIVKKVARNEKITSLILTEGYMDVISLSQAGIKNVIASMGTSLTVEQCAEIKRYVGEVYVSYDGDAAGQSATWRSLDLLAAAGLEVKVVSMPEGLDPDDTIKKYGKEGYLKLLGEALPLVEFKIRTVASRFNLNTLDGRNKFASAAVEILAGLPEITREVYIKEVSSLSALSEDTISNSIKNFKAAAPREPRRPPEEEEKRKIEISPEEHAKIVAARYILISAFALRDYVRAGDLNESYFTYPPHSEAYKYLTRCIEKKTPPKAGDLFDVLSGYKEELDAIVNDGIPEERQEKHYNDCVAILEKSLNEKRRLEIVGRLKTAEGEEKESLKAELRKIIRS